MFREINLVHVPGLFRLLREGETLDDLRRLTPEQILIRWVNYHMDRAGVGRHLSNFTTDVTDSIIYSHLLHQIAPSANGVSLAPLSVQGNVPRAGAMLDEADKIQCREFVSANDVATGNYKLNLAFVANLFNKYPNLPEPDADQIRRLRRQRIVLLVSKRFCSGNGNARGDARGKNVSKLDEQFGLRSIRQLALLGPPKRPHYFPGL